MQAPNYVTQFSTPITFTTIMNGSYPFKISVNQNTAVISGLVRDTDDQYHDVRSYKFTEFFVGHSPKSTMTTFSGAIGPKHDGNSVLFLVGRDDKGMYEYVWVGSDYKVFKMQHHIVFYISEIGNNDVPYPWAYDDHGNLILFNSVPNTVTLVRNMPPKFDTSRILNNTQDYLLLPNVTKSFKGDSITTAQRLNKERSEVPDIYDIYWRVMRCNKSSNLNDWCRQITEHIPVTNELRGVDIIGPRRWLPSEKKPNKNAKSKTMRRK